jgi:hypothetical protein
MRYYLLVCHSFAARTDKQRLRDLLPGGWMQRFTVIEKGLPENAVCLRYSARSDESQQYIAGRAAVF